MTFSREFMTVIPLFIKDTLITTPYDKESTQHIQNGNGGERLFTTLVHFWLFDQLTEQVKPEIINTVIPTKTG